MKKIIITILILNIVFFSIIFYIIQPKPEYLPKDDGKKGKYLYAGNSEVICSKCREGTNLFKVDSKNFPICKGCFQKIKGK